MVVRNFACDYCYFGKNKVGGKKFLHVYSNEFVQPMGDNSHSCISLYFRVFAIVT